MPAPKDYKGKKYGKLTAIKWTGKRKKYGKHTKRIWQFKCDCGTICEFEFLKVYRGWNTSCGCAKGKYSGPMSTAHEIYSRTYSNGDLTFEDFYHMSQKPCWYCGAPPHRIRKIRDKNPFCYNGLDRMDNNLPHNKSNCVPCCWKCNDMKNKHHWKDFINHCRTIAILHQ